MLPTWVTYISLSRRPIDERRIHRGGGLGEHSIKQRGLETRAPRIAPPASPRESTPSTPSPVSAEVNSIGAKSRNG